MIKKYFATTLFVLFMAIAILPFGAEAAQTEDVIISTYTNADNARGTTYTWFYKEVDGQRYMRLYDATHGVWVTDWIPVEG